MSRMTGAKKGPDTRRSGLVSPPGKPDPRQTSMFPLLGDSGVQAEVRPVARVQLESREVLSYQPPNPVAFYLNEGKRHQDRGASQRRSIMGDLLREGGYLVPRRVSAALDCLAELSVAVLFSFAAIESLANDAVENLDESATLEVKRGGELVEVERDDMIRRLQMDEKLSLVVPQLSLGSNIKGTAAWQRFVHLRRLRNDLVHVTNEGYSFDPEEPSAYDQLFVGEADECADDAFRIITSARADFLDEHQVAAFGELYG